MAALSCEICGGKLIGKPGGIFECDSCGMEYDTSWAKAKVQEIKGTVQIEGAVEVQGTVKIEGGINVDTLLTHGRLELDDGRLNMAKKLFQQAIELDPMCGEAYWGYVLASNHVRTFEDLKERYVEQPYLFDNDLNFQRAKKYATAEIKFLFDELITAYQGYEKQKTKRGLQMSPAYEKRRKELSQVSKMLRAGGDRIICLKSNGTVIIMVCHEYARVGQGDLNIISIPEWKNLIAVDTGPYFAVGLKSDGTVVVIGDVLNPIGSSNLQCFDWQDIIDISVGRDHIVGVKSDGTVLATGENREGQCNVKNWSNIIAVTAGNGHTIGLKSNGTVVATGSNTSNQCDVNNWSNIVMIGASGDQTVALKENGTVVATGSISESVADQLSCWSDIVAISAGANHIVGLRLNGTVVIVGYDFWGQRHMRNIDDVLGIAAGNRMTAVLCRNGEIWRTRISQSEKCNVPISDLKLFNGFESLEADCKIANALGAEYISLQTELANLKGVFSFKRRNEITARMMEISTKLEQL